MKRAYNLWTQEEIETLKSQYLNHHYKDLVQFLPNHTRSAIAHKIDELKLKKPQRRKCYLSSLLEETPEAYYWIGFLLADGNFSKNRKISLTIAEKDIEHLHKVQTYVKSENTYYKVGTSNCYRLHMTGVNSVKALIEKFNINSNKTKFPCSLEHMLKYPDLFFSFIIGYIDGDGCVCVRNNSANISIVGDVAWIDNFILIFEFVHEYLNVKPTNQIPKKRAVFTKLPQS